MADNSDSDDDEPITNLLKPEAPSAVLEAEIVGMVEDEDSDDNNEKAGGNGNDNDDEGDSEGDSEGEEGYWDA